MAEVLVAAALLALALLIVARSLAGRGSAARSAAAARHVAALFDGQRWKSLSTNRAHGVQFERRGHEWVWWEVRDGNGNGLRTAELRSGVDRIVAGPQRMGAVVEHARLGFPPGGPFPEIPPGEGRIADTDDPVQFGSSDLIGFGPLGTSSSGTLYVTDGRHTLHGVVLFGATARIRIWRYDTRTGRWTR